MAILIPSDRDIRPVDPPRYGRHLSPGEQVQERLLTATPLTQRQLNVAGISTAVLKDGAGPAVLLPRRPDGAVRRTTDPPPTWRGSPLQPPRFWGRDDLATPGTDCQGGQYPVWMGAADDRGLR